jgi:hypothetical protein
MKGQSLIPRTVKELLISLGLILLPAIGVGLPGQPVFREDFDRPDGLVTNEHAALHPSAPGVMTSPQWEVTGGSLFVIDGRGWTGIPDSPRPDAFSSNGTRSVIFRMLTKKNVFGDVQVDFLLLNQGMTETQATPATEWDGAHVLLRYQNENSLYAASINRRDDTVTIKKRISTGYVDLTEPRPYAVPRDAWQKVRAVVKNNPDGSVAIQLFSNGRLLTGAVDKGIGGPPITQPGRLGFRGDNANLKFDDIVVTALRDVSASPAPSAAAPQGPSAPFVNFLSNFNAPNGLITNEFAYWNPNGAGAKHSPQWDVTSGSLFASGGKGWTGVPDDAPATSDSSQGSGSSVFRMTTKRHDFTDVEVRFKLLNRGLKTSPRTPAASWDGTHIFLRHVNEAWLYYASINRRDNMVIIKKKVPGGPSNGGTYHNLSSPKPYAVPYNVWQDIRATVKTNDDGSVTIQLFANNKLLVSATDAGVGGPPITQSGSVGIRGDNANLMFEDYAVSALVPPAPTAISGVSANDVTPGGAAIQWSTDLDATSQVEYGRTAAYGHATKATPELTQTHRVALSGLSPNTLYHFRVKSTDVNGNEAVSEGHTFVTAPPVPSNLPFADNFDQPDGLITNEEANPDAPATAGSSAANWEVSSGSLFASGGKGWTGVPDDEDPGDSSASGTNSSVFRMATKRADFVDTDVNFKLLNKHLVSTPSTPETAWDGAHLYLRYHSEQSFYAVALNRRDNTVMIKKKSPGTGKKSTFHELIAPVSYSVPYGEWQKARVTAKNDPNGTVTIRLFINGKLLAETTDNGVGGPPLTQPGRIGLGGDNAELMFDDFTAMPLAAPTLESSAKAPQRFLSPALEDGINDEAVFEDTAREVTIVDIRGRKVFHASRNDSDPVIVWNCREDGRMVASGVYIAQILTRNSEKVYQSLVVVK